MYEREYFITRPIAKSGRAQTLRFDPSWEIDPGDLVEVQICDVDDPQVVLTASKTVSPLGTNGKGIYCDRIWGFEYGELVTCKVKRIRKGKKDGGA